MELLYLIYLIGGIVVAAISLYLHIYYISHSRRINSSYFKGLGLMFIGPVLLGISWAFFGAFACAGKENIVYGLSPFLTVINIIMTIVLLLNFMRCTNNN